MSRGSVRRLIDAIIEQPSPRAAAEAAHTSAGRLCEPGFQSGLTSMLRAELEAHGRSRRFVALTRLSEFMGALHRGDTPPELVVITAADAARPADAFQDTADEDARENTRDAWLRRIDPTGYLRSEIGLTQDYAGIPHSSSSRGNPDDELEQLSGAALDEPSNIEAATRLVAKGELYLRVGEDVQATEALDQAEAMLNTLGVHDPSGVQLADALNSVLRGDVADFESSALGRSITARSLYTRLRSARQHIYLRQGDLEGANRMRTAREYAEGSLRDGSQVNFDFTQAMLRNLRAL